MWKRNLLSSLVSVSLLTAPVAASAAERIPAPVAGTEAEQIAENPWIPIVVGLVVAVVIVWLVLDDEDQDEPESP